MSQYCYKRSSNTPHKLLPACTAGCLATVAALSFGLLQFKRGNTKRSQLAMRMRVLAQGGTVIALVVGVLWTTGRKKKD